MSAEYLNARIKLQTYWQFKLCFRERLQIIAMIKGETTDLSNSKNQNQKNRQTKA